MRRLTINERYRVISRHKSKRYNLIYVLIIALLLMVPATFSRYTNAAEGEAKASIAKWQITVNGESVTTNSTLNNKIDLVYANQTNGIILPGETGYFDVVLNPAETEVSIQYTIEIDLSNMPSGMQLTGYSLNSGETIAFPTDNTLIGELRLRNNQKLDNSDIQTYRVYWQWTGSSSVTASSNYFVNANVDVKQII